MGIKKIIFFLLATVFAGGCSMFKVVEYKTEKGIALEQLGFDLDYDEETKKVKLCSSTGELIMTLNRRISLFNGTKVWLFSPVKFDDDEILRISESDVEKIIKPLMSKKYPLPSVVKRIIVDAGHGGEDTGAIGLKSKEKDLNLALSRKVKTALEAKGFEVIMTRDEDKFLTLDERSKFAAENKADLFICIHHNASGSTKAANGIESYSLSPANVNSTHDKKDTVPSGELPGNIFDEANINLSYYIQSCVINNTAANDRGMKFARFKVLVNAPCPAILFEAGFISNPSEEIAINSSERQDKTAKAIAEAVEKFSENANKNLQK